MTLPALALTTSGDPAADAAQSCAQLWWTRPGGSHVVGYLHRDGHVSGVTLTEADGTRWRIATLADLP